MATPNYAAGDIGTCQACGRAIRWGTPYMPAIPFRGSWGGFSHQNCPPTLTVIIGSRS